MLIWRSSRISLGGLNWIGEMFLFDWIDWSIPLVSSFRHRLTENNLFVIVILSDWAKLCRITKFISFDFDKSGRNVRTFYCHINWKSLFEEEQCSIRERKTVESTKTIAFFLDSTQPPIKVRWLAVAWLFFSDFTCLPIAQRCHTDDFLKDK